MHWLLLVEAPTMKAMKDLINHLTIALMNTFADKRPKFMLRWEPMLKPRKHPYIIVSKQILKCVKALPIIVGCTFY